MNRFRLSSVLFFISCILLFYGSLFQVRYTVTILGLSWMLLAISRALVMFPDLYKKAEVKIGKEISLKAKEIKCK